MSLVYDAGALIAADSDDRGLWADHRAELEAGDMPITTAPVVAQVSRSLRQARLRMLLAACDVVALTEGDAHEIGLLLAETGTSDVVDAHVALVGAGREIVTSDPGDIEQLAVHVEPRPIVRPV